MWNNEYTNLLRAIQFLTRLPIKLSADQSDQPYSKSLRYYPVVGALIGASCAAVFWLTSIILPPLLAVLLSTMAGFVMTGALHEDGLADSCDGLGGGSTLESKLDIMRDSHIGTYGVLAVSTTIATKITALAHLQPNVLIAGLIVAHGLSRLSCVMTIASSQYVRNEGTATSLSEDVSDFTLYAALLSGACLILMTAIALSPLAAGMILIGFALGYCLLRYLSESSIEGYTGDTLGAQQQVSELGIYLGLVAWTTFQNGGINAIS